MGRRGKRQKPAAPPQFKFGDRVRVKHHVVDSEYDDIPLGGWRGKVIEVRYLNPPSYLVRWDAETLAKIHPVYKKRCQRDGSDYRGMSFYEEDLEPDPGGPLEIKQPTQIVTRPLSMDEEETGYGLCSGSPPMTRYPSETGTPSGYTTAPPQRPDRR